MRALQRFMSLFSRAKARKPARDFGFGRLQFIITLVNSRSCFLVSSSCLYMFVEKSGLKNLIWTLCCERYLHNKLSLFGYGRVKHGITMKNLLHNSTFWHDELRGEDFQQFIFGSCCSKARKHVRKMEEGYWKWTAIKNNFISLLPTHRIFNIEL